MTSADQVAHATWLAIEQAPSETEGEDEDEKDELMEDNSTGILSQVSLFFILIVPLGLPHTSCMGQTY